MSTGAARAQNRVSDVWPRRSAKRVGAAYARGGNRFLARIASHWRRDARERSLRACRRRHRGSVVDADTAEARELHGGMAQIETCDQAEDVNLDALDPTHPDAPRTPHPSPPTPPPSPHPSLHVGTSD